MQNDEKEIRKLVDTWISASRAGDLETVLGLMTDDVVFLTPGQPPMIGKEAFAAASKAQSQQPFEIDGVSDIQEIRVFGDWAYMWTKLSVAVKPTKNAKPIRRAGHTLTILKKQGGGWLLARDANLLTVVSESEWSSRDATP
ncbi:MAG: SgcJ/EcaC family oxidoreductase [Chloracidobacterium sp.]|nr:SgcJ/EcaC family oxidoreductase [Chloracidobacterium sp.]